MHENYCFQCGSYTRIDDVTKLCHACYGHWPLASGETARSLSPRLG
jgi:hypothetical protein